MPNKILLNITLNCPLIPTNEAGIPREGIMLLIRGVNAEFT